MPQLAEWMLHYPADWTSAQAGQYVQLVQSDLVHRVIPPMQALGPTRVVGIMLSIIALIAERNPVHCRDICELMANTFDIVDQLDPLAGATKQ